MRILHISDVHVQMDYDADSWRRMGWRRMAGQLELKLARRARRYVKAPETIGRLVEEGLRQGADHVILSGDLTALAVDAEFEAARKALGPLADRPDLLTVVPGNHDIFTPGSRDKKRFDSWFGHLLGSDLPELRGEGAWPHVRLVGEDVAVVGLCSARVPLVPGIASGLVGEAQLRSLEKICADRRVRGRSIHVVVHHAPLRWDGSVDRRDHGLADARALIDVCARGGVAAIHCGHIHIRYAWQVPGGPMVVGGGSSTWLGHEGYWLVDAEGGRLTGLQNMALAPLEAEVEAPAGLVPTTG
ncbi:metallophosphoesterase family protein [Vulgatibacter sp.]|uniref:metallophosphoesterase family protein n=1 Tax=Vulgatibacter sp. TaxID=1971226 RepID=UPI0035659064